MLVRRRKSVRSAILSIAVVVAASAAGSASAAVVQRLDFETANFNQWTEVQSACTGGGYDKAGVGNSCASIVTSPKREGSYAGRFKIAPWTDGTSSHPRAEAYVDKTATGAVDGQQWYYAWSTMFPSSENTGWWSKGGNWNYFTQMHGTGPVGAIFALGVDATGTTPSIYFEHMTKNPSDLSVDLKLEKTVLGPIRFDQWYDFVMRVRFSSSADNGLVEIWVDGTKWLTQTGITLTPGGAYLKQGYYGGAHGGTNVVYHDGMRRASALSDVLADAPAPVTPQPAPVEPQPPVAQPKPKPKPAPKPKLTRPRTAASSAGTQSATRLRWDGRTYTSARGLRSALGARGVGWDSFVRSHPAVASKFELVPVRWSGLAFYSRASLARRLALEGSSYRRFALRHPAAAARLQRNDRL